MREPIPKKGSFFTFHVEQVPCGEPFEIIFADDILAIPMDARSDLLLAFAK